MKYLTLALIFILISCSNSKEQAFSYGIYSITQINGLKKDLKEGDIEIKGYLDINGDILYLSKDHEKILDTANSVPVVLPENEDNYKILKQCYSNYVSITGKLKKNARHGLPEIRDIKRLYTQPLDNSSSIFCIPKNQIHGQTYTR